MGVFEDILIKAKGAVDAFGEKAGQYVDVSKLNIKLAELKAELKSEFENLGKTVYKNEKEGVEDNADVKMSIAQINNISLQIEDLKNQIASLKNKILCKACGNQNETSAIYCARCGKKLDEQTKEKSDSQKDEIDDFADFED